MISYSRSIMSSVTCQFSVMLCFVARLWLWLKVMLKQYLGKPCYQAGFMCICEDSSICCSVFLRTGRGEQAGLAFFIYSAVSIC